MVVKKVEQGKERKAEDEERIVHLCVFMFVLSRSEEGKKYQDKMEAN